MIQLLRYGVAISIGFGLGAAFVGFGFQAGLSFWVVIAGVAVVKVLVIQAYTAIRRRRDEPTWQDMLASPQGDRIAPSPHPERTRLVRPM